MEEIGKKLTRLLKHDRYNNLNKGNIKNLLHALRALFLLNIYNKNETFIFKYQDFSKFDFSLGSDVFSLSRGNTNYVFSETNNRIDHAILQANESPFILKYTSDSYKEILTSKTLAESSLREFVEKQSEFKDKDFLKFIEGKNINQIMNEIGKFRINNLIPAYLSFDERKKLLEENNLWKSYLMNNRMSENDCEITRENIQQKLNLSGLLWANNIIFDYNNKWLNLALSEGLCELVIDDGTIKYTEYENL